MKTILVKSISLLNLRNYFISIKIEPELHHILESFFEKTFNLRLFKSKHDFGDHYSYLFFIGKLKIL